jgi:phospholipid/cholesterol/gamma-HCH transport system substrate-binding protein
MKTGNTISNVKLGAFVSAGALFLVFSLYMIGRNQNLFGPTFSVTANFANINGLVTGNNVRYSGINVGSVKEIEITNDSVVVVTMLIEKRVKGFIKANAVASIGTDGLMGNKLVNINPGTGQAAALDDGSVLRSQGPVETDEMLRTLKGTNDNIAVITTNFKDISTRLNSNNSLWSILGDTLIAHDVRRGIANLRQASTNMSRLTGNADLMVRKFTNSKGLASALFTDTLLRKSLEASIANVKTASFNLNRASDELKTSIALIKTGNGPISAMLSDSISSEKLKNSISNIETGTAKFSENMEALKHHFLFKGYFEKLEEENKKVEKKNKK